MKTQELRTLRGLTVREAPKDSGYIGQLVGHAAVFNSDSVEFAGWGKPWIERIAPGAFARSLKDNPDVVALWSHRTDSPIARAPATMAIAEDTEGLAVTISLADTTRNRDLLADVRAGTVDAMSFGFEVKSEQWEKGEAHDTRTLLDVDLFEVSAVVFPAYPGTSLAARSLVCRSGGPELEREMAAVSARREAALRAVAPPYHFSHWLAGVPAGPRPA